MAVVTLENNRYKIVLYLVLLFVTFKVQWFWIMACINNTSKSLFSRISVIRHFKELWSHNFVISMSASSYKWNALHPGFLSSVSITLITRYLLTMSLRNALFLLKIACQRALMGVISCGWILWVFLKNNTITPKIWNNVADAPQSCILPPDVLLRQN